MEEYNVTRSKFFWLTCKNDPYQEYRVAFEESDTEAGYRFRLNVEYEAGPWEHFDKAPYIFRRHMALSPYFTESGEWEVYRIEKAR